jgi:hypothetical protein
VAQAVITAMGMVAAENPGISIESAFSSLRKYELSSWPLECI